VRRVRHHPIRALTAIGISTVAAAYAVEGGLPLDPSLSASLLHAGTYALLLAGTATALDRVSALPDHRGVAAAVLALAALYPVAIVLVRVSPPAHYDPAPSLAALALDRLEVVPVLMPLTAGYVLGTFDGAPRDGRSAAIPVFAVALVVAGPVLAASVAARDGGLHFFTVGVYGLSAVGTVVGSIPLYLVGRWESADPAGTSGDATPEPPA